MDLPVIKQLSTHLTNLIAAGEVIERPASVVKELIENSIDAKADHIRIDLLGSGLKKIEVTDNGIGMTKSQLPEAIKPHATSKIKDEDDLFNIHTLGFRGEALPSIVSISLFTITSATESSNGYFYKYRAGTKTAEGEIAFPKGTKVEVENLFFNTPARFKNLSNEALELSHITSLINKLAIANPNIAFSLTNNGRLIYQTSGDNDMIKILSATFGLEVAKYSISFKGQNNLYKISGYTSSNNVFRSNKNGINIIINNRIIRNISLQYAIIDAYKSIIPVGKYPITTLFINCDSSLIDVNVHPSKLEIRFTEEQALRSFITSTIDQALVNANLTYNATSNDVSNEKEDNKEITLDSLFNQSSSNLVISEKEDSNDLIDNNQSVLNESIKSISDDLFDMFQTTKQESNDLLEEETIQNDYDNSYSDEQKEDEFTDNDDIEVIKQNYVQDSLEVKLNKFSDLNYIGQYHHTYLLLEGNGDLYLIDQHAAMERCMYEKISKCFKEKDTHSYELLVPLNIDFTSFEIPLVLNISDELKSLGFEIEHFGGCTIKVRTIPTWVKKGYEKETTYDVINHLLLNKSASMDVIYDSLAKKIACKKSIKASMVMIKEEVYTLLNSLDECKMPYTCPHGRPTLVKFTNYEIEKLFKRVI